MISSTSDCCNFSNSASSAELIDQREAVSNRYGAAAINKEQCLCTPVEFNKELLKAIPKEIIEKDYGCGDPTKWVQKGDRVLDLGSGSGKNAFICSQAVGPSGHVIGVDNNNVMLELAREAAPKVAEKIGYSNVNFLEGLIEALDKKNTEGGQLIPTASIDIIISNCVLNLVNQSERNSLLKNIRRVLSDEGRVAISDIVCNKEVPIELKKDPDLWSGCISGAWNEEDFISDFCKLGFKQVKFAERSKNPWKVIKGIEFRAVTLTGKL